ncbi:MAG: folate family ECF transporter S component [Oscillospiraceae bacterium]
MSKWERGRRWAAAAGAAALVLVNLLAWSRADRAQLLIIDVVAVSLLALLCFARRWNGGARTLVALAFLCALSVVLSRILAINTHSVRVGLGNVPIILAGLLYGPLAGALVGFAADLVGALALSSFGYMPLLAISPILVGGLPGLLKPLLLRKGVTPLRLGIICFGTAVVASIGWTSYCVFLLYGTPLKELLAVRTPLYLAMALADTAVIWLLVRSGAFKSRGLVAVRKTAGAAQSAPEKGDGEV